MKTVKSAYKEFKKKENIEWEEYRDINYLFNKKVSERLLNGLEVKLPHSMGALQIRKREVDPDKAPIDFNETRLARIKDPNAPVIRHFNFHSDGYAARVGWMKRYTVSNIKNYVFYPARRNDGKSLSEKVVENMKTVGGHKKYIKR